MGEINKEPGNHPVAWKAAQVRDMQEGVRGWHPTCEDGTVREGWLGPVKNKGNSVPDRGNSKCKGWKV